MKNQVLLPAFLFVSLYAHCQQASINKRYFAIHIYNDALNITVPATDWGYTNGLKADFFHQKKNSGFLHQLAGVNSIGTSGWGIMQMIVAPKGTKSFIPDKNDYPYSGALVGIHTSHFANPVSKINLQAELILGLMGQPSFAKETQIFVHHLIKDPRPNGWNYQLPTDLLLNYNFKAEKQLVSLRNIALIGGGDFFCGTLMNGMSLNMLLRFEKDPGYFSGLSRQYFTSKKPKLIVAFRSTFDFIAYNALLDGGLFNAASPMQNKNSKFGSDLKRQQIGGSIDFLVLLSMRKFAIAFSQKTVSPEFKKYEPHTVGNISIYKTY